MLSYGSDVDLDDHVVSPYWPYAVIIQYDRAMLSVAPNGAVVGRVLIDASILPMYNAAAEEKCLSGSICMCCSPYQQPISLLYLSL